MLLGGKNWRPRLSLRLKIVLLIATVLILSLLSYLSLGTSLIIRDKASSIYEYNSAEIQAASTRIESRIQETVKTATVIAGLLGGPAQDSGRLQSLFESLTSRQKIQALIILKPEDDQHFAPLAEFGRELVSAKNALAQAGWTPAVLMKSEMQTGGALNAMLPLGGTARDSQGNPLAFIALIPLQEDLIEGSGRSVQLHLLDQAGNRLLSRSGADFGAPPARLSDLQKEIPAPLDVTGVREWSSNGRDYLVSYRRMASGHLTLLSLIPRDLAFASARDLIHRSLLAGVAILLLASGMALIFARTLTSRLRQMGHATERVALGDFSCRVEMEGLARDELHGLAGSFNAMAERIDELMKETADKARMEKELETASAFQGRFFPAKPYRDGRIEVAGQYVPASECAGDWWHHARIGDFLIVVIGDVTGHGVQAALFTALMHGAFHQWLRLGVRQVRDPENAESILSHLMESLNAAVFGSSSGSLMTFLALCIHLPSGKMSVANASHPWPYLYREGKLSLLAGTPSEPLGLLPEIQLHLVSRELKPGDWFLLYTDGLFEPRPGDSRRMGKTRFLSALRELIQEEGSHTESVSLRTIQRSLEFFGPQGKSNPDDITVLVGQVLS